MMPLLFRKISFLALLLLLTGCSTVIPVHEGETPEVLSGGDFRLTTFAANSPMLATETATNTNAAILYPSEGYRLGIGILERLQLNVEMLAAAASVGASYSLKYQWLGDNYFSAKKGNRSQSTIVRSLSSAGVDIDVNEEGNVYPYADLVAKGIDIAHLFGYRTANWFGLYGGPKFITGDVTAEYKNVEDGPVIETEKRKFSGVGVIAGLHFSFTSDHIGLDIIAEYDGFQLPASYGPDKVWYNGYTLAVGIPFGF
jgi:hypothetical protein